MPGGRARVATAKPGNFVGDDGSSDGELYDSEDEAYNNEDDFGKDGDEEEDYDYSDDSFEGGDGSDDDGYDSYDEGQYGGGRGASKGKQGRPQPRRGGRGGGRRRLPPQPARMQQLKARLAGAQEGLKTKMTGVTHKGAKVIRELKVRVRGWRGKSGLVAQDFVVASASYVISEKRKLGFVLARFLWKDAWRTLCVKSIKSEVVNARPSFLSSS